MWGDFLTNVGSVVVSGWGIVVLIFGDEESVKFKEVQDVSI